MKRLRRAFALAAVLTLCCFAVSRAELVSPDEARRIANNWIQLIIYSTGDWGGNNKAEVARMDEFRDDDRLLGYYCEVEPSGFAIVSLVKGLAPVKVYSGASGLDIDADDGPAGLYKFQMSRMIRELELQAGPVAEINTDDVEQIMEFKYGETLNRLNVPADVFVRDLSLWASKANYSEGEILLTSHWHQFDPYFRQVPAAHNGCTETNCTVGCVALAAAQIMRYWSWPPGRDWSRMLDIVTASSPQASIDAVAELNSSLGIAVGMDYCSDGCASSVPTMDMELVYEVWHYGDCAVAHRVIFPASTWWSGPGMVKAQLNANRPIQYRIMGHSIVLDGWREWFHGSYQPEYHMNYGWDDTNNAWYLMDGLLQVVDTASWVHEYMIIGIVPTNSFGGYVAGPVYKEPWNYRYVDRDCYGTAADFYPGQFIQFLPNVKLKCEETFVKFTGTPEENTVLYTPEPDRGIRIHNGAMVFHPGGAIKFQQERPGP